MHQQSGDRIIMYREDEYGNCDSMLSEYCLKSKKYNELSWSDTGRVSGYGIVSSLDERYIVRFGGTQCIDGEDVSVDEIIMFDLKTETVSKSDTKCPVRSNYRAVLFGNRMQDELVVFGFMNQSFKSPEMLDVQVLPIHIVQLMSKWYHNERVYLISMMSDMKEHWVVNMDEII